jgi:hypothetical protein
MATAYDLPSGRGELLRRDFPVASTLQEAKSLRQKLTRAAMIASRSDSRSAADLGMPSGVAAFGFPEITIFKRSKTFRSAVIELEHV